jgi:hypothetical protein
MPFVFIVPGEINVLNRRLDEILRET